MRCPGLQVFLSCPSFDSETTLLAFFQDSHNFKYLTVLPDDTAGHMFEFWKPCTSGKIRDLEKIVCMRLKILNCPKGVSL